MACPNATQSVHAVIYARVSSKEQEKEGFSIPAQQKLLSGYAANQRFEVMREFVDVETAKRAGRTGFGEMIACLKAEFQVPRSARRENRSSIPQSERLRHPR